MFLLSIEGIDASGKATQTEKLRKYISNLNLKVEKLNFPKYDSITGKLIKDYLSGNTKISSNNILNEAYLFQCTQIVNRLECLPKDIWTADSDTIYISDRYNTSAIAYGLASNLDFEWLYKAQEHLPTPKFNVFIDIPVEESFRRRPDRRDQYEKNKDLLIKVRQSYLEIFNRMSEGHFIVDGMKSEEEVFQNILKIIDGELHD